MIRFNRSFVLILLASFSYALLVGGTLPFYIFYSLLFIFIAGYTYISIQDYCVKAEVKLPRNILETGEEMECLTMIKCSTILPVFFVVVKSLSYIKAFSDCEGEILNITRQEDCWVRKDIRFYRRGIYNLGNLDLILKDAFHIFILNKAIDCKAVVKVYPKLIEIRKFPLGGKDIYQHSLDIRSNNEDMFTIKDIRKYNEGDSLKKVHWKVSAKYGELYVKNSDNIFGEEFTIFLDMNKNNMLLDNNGEIEEAMVDLCISMVNFMQQKSICTKVFINSALGRCQDINTKEDFNKLMDFFLNQFSDGEEDFSEFLYKNFYKLQRNNRIAIITGALTENMCRVIGKIKNYGYFLSVYFSFEDEKFLEICKTLNNIGVDCIKVR